MKYWLFLEKLKGVLVLGGVLICERERVADIVPQGDSQFIACDVWGESLELLCMSQHFCFRHFHVLALNVDPCEIRPAVKAPHCFLSIDEI